MEWNGGGRHGEEKKLPLELRRYYSLREKNGRKRKEVQESNVILIPNYSARSTAIYLEGTQGGARAGVITRRDDASRKGGEGKEGDIEHTRLTRSHAR